MPFKDDTKQKLVPFIMGKQNAEERKGKALLEIFAGLGVRDAWKGALPFYPGREQPMYKKDYVASRLDMINEQAIIQLLTMVVNEAESEDTVREINELILKDHYSVSSQDGIYVILGNVAAPVGISPSQVHFQQIEAKVLDALDKAKVSIWLAMAWFTNERLQKKLVQKSQEGLDIRVIIFKDGVNKTHGVDLTGFDVVEMRGSRGGIMHNKFCVIDNQVVVSGSYNWSDGAEFRNDENVSVNPNNDFATAHSLEFKRLLKEHEQKQLRKASKSPVPDQD